VHVEGRGNELSSRCDYYGKRWGKRGFRDLSGRPMIGRMRDRDSEKFERLSEIEFHET
jgi:hypothetical protein